MPSAPEGGREGDGREGRPGRDRRRDRGRRGDGRLLDDDAVAGRKRVLDAAEPDRAHVLAGRATGRHVQRPSAGHWHGVHMMMAMLFGTLIAAAAYRLPAAR